MKTNPCFVLRKGRQYPSLGLQIYESGELHQQPKHGDVSHRYFFGKRKRSTYHEFNNVDTKMFVNHSTQADAGPGKPGKHSMIGSIDDEFHIRLDPEVLGLYNASGFTLTAIPNSSTSSSSATIRLASPSFRLPPIKTNFTGLSPSDAKRCSG